MHTNAKRLAATASWLLPDQLSSFALARAAGEVMKSDIVRKVGFTGSTAVGKILMKQAADTVKKVRLGSQGRDPVSVEFCRHALPIGFVSCSTPPFQAGSGHASSVAVSTCQAL